MSAPEMKTTVVDESGLLQAKGLLNVEGRKVVTSPSAILRAEAVKADAMALEESKIADSCQAEVNRRLESASDYRHYAEQLRADADRLEARRTELVQHVESTLPASDVTNIANTILGAS